VAQKIIDLIGKPFMLADYQANIGTSIGVSLYPQHGTDKFMLLKHADAAMYLAKERGRNTYQFYSEN
jgi:diguanylate cyclase (GGDEF)-like protein